MQYKSSSILVFNGTSYLSSMIKVTYRNRKAQITVQNYVAFSAIMYYNFIIDCNNLKLCLKIYLNHEKIQKQKNEYLNTVHKILWKK